MEIPQIAFPLKVSSESECAEAPCIRAQQQADDTNERFAMLASRLNVAPQHVTYPDRANRNGTVDSHYFRVEVAARNSIDHPLQLSLIVTSDLQQVFALAPLPATTTIDQIIELLEHHNICSIDRSGLGRMIEREGGVLARCWVRIARAAAADGSCGTNLVSDFLARVEGDAVDALHHALASQSNVNLAQESSEAQATFVQVGQELVPDDARLPTDIFGRQQARPPLQAGPGVKLIETRQGHKPVAERYGYLYLVSHTRDIENRFEIAIRSPIEIGTGSLHADFLILPCGDGSNYPSAMDIQLIVASHGVCCGIDPAACNRASLAMQKPDTEPQLQILARGRLPQPGRDGLVSRADGTKRPTSSRLDAVWPTGTSVSEGTILAVLDAAAAGEPGYTGLGDRLEATAGAPVTLNAGNNVEVEVLHGVKSLFRAATEGMVVFGDHSVEVVPLPAK